MQWDGSPNAGFTTGKPWLGINSNYTRIKHGLQINDPDSIRSYYKKAIALRNSESLLIYGSFTPLEISRELFIYKRELDGRSMTILLNFSARRQMTGYKGTVVLSNYKRESFDGSLSPYEAVILG
jgi:glycosidase